MSDRDELERTRSNPDESTPGQSSAKRPWIAPVVSRVELVTSTKKCFAAIEGILDGPS